MKVHELILKINSSLDPRHKKNITEVNKGVNSVNTNLSNLTKQQSNLKAINLNITNYEKVTNSISSVKATQKSLTEEINRYKVIANRRDISSQTYADAQSKLKLLNSEYRKSENQLTKLQIKDKTITALLNKEGITTKNLSSSKIDLNSRLKSLDQSIKKTTQSSKNQTNAFKNQSKAQNRLSSSMKNLIGLGAAYFSISKVKSFYAESIDLAKDQLKAETDLTAMLKNNKHLKGNSIAIAKANQELKDYASELQNIGVIGDEVTIAGQSQLATFQLQASTLKKLSPCMLDMLAKSKGLAAGQGDATNVANLLGKVMSGQIGALGRYGVSFSKAQEDVLKFGNEQERASTLARVLEENFGGANKALAATPIGIIQSFQNAWGDMKEEVGKEVLPQMSDFFKFAQGNIPAVQNTIIGGTRAIMNGGKFVIKHHKLIMGLGVAYGTYKGIQLTVQGVQKGIDLWKSAKTIPLKYKEMVANKGLTLSELANKGALIASSVATKAYTAAQWLMNAAMTANPIGLVIAGIAALGAGLVFAYKKSEAFRNVINGTWDKIKGFWKSLDNNPFTRIAKNILIATNPLLMMWKAVSKIKGLWDKFKGKNKKSTITTDIVTNNSSNIPKYAVGGLVSSPQIAMVGEGGDKEMIIPVNSSGRSKSLFYQTGKMLGINHENFMNLESPKTDFLGKMTKFISHTKEKVINTVNDSPVKVEISITINGDISSEKAREVGKQVGEGFKDKLEQIARKGGRLALG